MSVCASAETTRPSAARSLFGLKAALVVVLLVPLINPDWQQFEDKGMHWRVLVFPLAGLVIPVLWRATGSRAPYPYLADGLLVMVPLTDVLWNTVDAYDRLWWWDDLSHLLNSAVIAYAVGLWLRRYPAGQVARFLLIVGTGMTLAVGWELAEYPTFLNSSAELGSVYQDTLADLGLALIGSTFAAVLSTRQPQVDPIGEPSELEPALAQQ